VWVIKFAQELGTPILSFTVTGGLGIHVKIANNGSASATGVVWQVHTEGGILHRMNHTVNGTVDIAVGETKIVRMEMLFGLGDIKVTSRVGDMTKVAEGKQMLILSILKR